MTALTPESVLSALNNANADWQVKLEAGVLWVMPQSLLDVCAWLKEDGALRLDYLANLTAVDYPPDHIDMVYHLCSIEHKSGTVVLKVRLSRQEPVVDSVTPIWRGAEFQEREVYDLFGVVFEGHPDLRRILMWDEFEGFPMRKDYVAEDQDVN